MVPSFSSAGEGVHAADWCGRSNSPRAVAQLGERDHCGQGSAAVRILVSNLYDRRPANAEDRGDDCAPCSEAMVLSRVIVADRVPANGESERSCTRCNTGVVRHASSSAGAPQDTTRTQLPRPTTCTAGLRDPDHSPARQAGHAASVRFVKGVVVALLVLVVLLTGLPVVVAGQSMPGCPSCDEGVPVWPMCFAVLPAAALFLALASRRLRALADVRPALLYAVVPHPPPRIG